MDREREDEMKLGGSVELVSLASHDFGELDFAELLEDDTGSLLILGIEFCFGAFVAFCCLDYLVYFLLLYFTVLYLWNVKIEIEEWKKMRVEKLNTLMTLRSKFRFALRSGKRGYRVASEPGKRESVNLVHLSNLEYDKRKRKMRRSSLGPDANDSSNSMRVLDSSFESLKPIRRNSIRKAKRFLLKNLNLRNKNDPEYMTTQEAVNRRSRQREKFEKRASIENKADLKYLDL